MEPIDKQKTDDVPKNNLKILTRFNTIYENPIDLLTEFLSGKTTFYKIGRKCLNNTINPELRPIFYRIFLGILPYDKPWQWKDILKDKRNQYEEKVKKYILTRNASTLPFINCHSLKGSKEYETLLEQIESTDKDALALIKLDVDRTFQDLDLFRNDKVKEIFGKILFIFSLENPVPGYCQGMNEILGTLLFLFLPGIKFGENKNEQGDIEDLINFISSEDFLEHDLYLVFTELMSRDLTNLYKYNLPIYEKLSLSPEELKNVTEEDIDKGKESDLVKRIKKLFYIRFKNSEKEYFERILGIVEPTLFLLRWYLCLLDRELTLKKAIWTWDCILFYEFIEFSLLNLSQVTHLNFLDDLCLSMIINLKKNVYESDNATVLYNFMKFPNERNLRTILKDAVLIYHIKIGVDIWEKAEMKKKINYIENGKIVEKLNN